jgi:hypothetical protein
MSTQYIPQEILDNPNIDMSDTNRIKEINDLFQEISESGVNNNSHDVKELIDEINGRYNAEKELKQKKEYHKRVQQELLEANKELEYLKSLR